MITTWPIGIIMTVSIVVNAVLIKKFFSVAVNRKYIVGHRDKAWKNHDTIVILLILIGAIGLSMFWIFVALLGLCEASKYPFLITASSQQFKQCKWKEYNRFFLKHKLARGQRLACCRWRTMQNNPRASYNQQFLRKSRSPPENFRQLKQP